MAVLKDLIVHGPSRFVGITEFTNLKANKIKATEGIFNKLIATTADFDSMTANNATVVGLLDVKGELHTNSWTNSNIATIEGSFYITPTISCASGTFNYDGTNITLTAGSGRSFAISSLYINSGDNAGTTIAWSAYSEVLITGQVAVGNEKVPLGTIKGKITSTTPTTSKIIINSLTDGKGTASNVLASIGTGSKDFYDIKISLLKRGNGSNVANALPIGIYMTAMGQNGTTFLDIYGGHNAASTAVAGGLAKPVLRIGNLSGLPDVGGKTPGGYGIYTSNGYFTGTIVSTSGTIGNWSITSSSIQTGAFNTAGKMYFGNSGISLGTTFRVTSAGELTATSGTIGGITIGGTYLTTNAARQTYNATTAGLTITPTGIGAGNGTANTFKVVAATGALTAGNATLTGGSIAGWTFNTTSLYKTNATPGYSTSTMVISTGTKSTYNIGDGGTDEKTWMLSAGRGFGVTTAGTLYAIGAHISGAITATSFTAKRGSASAKNAATLNSNGLTIYNSSGTPIATFNDSISLASNGATVTIGKVATNNYNAYITTTDFQIRNNDAPIATFGNKITLGSSTFTGVSLSTGGLTISKYGDTIVDIATGTGSSLNGITSGIYYILGHYQVGLIGGLEPPPSYEEEGYGFCSLTEGAESYAIGDYSHASGYSIITRGDYQTAIGQFNNNSTSNAFEIGWGTADSARKNIFAVGTNGTVKINETNMNDFVIEQGNGYRKWNSGIAECWVNTSQNVAINNVYGSLYQGTWTWNFAITFNANPAVTCSLFKWGTGASWGTVSASSTKNAVLRGFDVVSRAAGTCNIAAYAIGRWK